MRIIFKFLENFWSEFKQYKTGIVGLSVLVIAILIVLFEGFIITYKEAPSRWRDITYWQDNSASAPPVWLNFFKSKKSPITENIIYEDIEIDNLVYKTKFVYDFKADEAPLDIILHSMITGNAAFNIKVTRPDGTSIVLFDEYYSDLNNTDLRVSLFNDAKTRVFRFYRESVSAIFRNKLDANTTSPMYVLFNTKGNDMASEFIPLKGKYIFETKTTFSENYTEEILFKNPYIVAVGSLSGFLGTDNMKRDLFSGLVIGLKWALFIGMATSFVSVIVGVMYGIVSAYFGGKIDISMQFVYQLFIGIPTLPVMIVMSAVFKPTIWTMIAMMITFSWTGSVMTVRSMAMQMKEETYIEAARALGAGHKRIIFSHLAPLLLPFSFASMALAVPSAIVYESSLSLLGLGDASIVTWGQILHDAMKGSAVLSGLWWWIVPPGLLIALLGMSFAFLGFALDKILHPKLKTR